MTGYNWAEAAPILEVVIGGGTIGWTLWRFAFNPFLLKPGTRMIKHIRSIPTLQQQNADILERLSNLSSTMNETLAELKPNGGSSLRDAVNRLDTKVDWSITLVRGLINSGDMLVEFDREGNLVGMSRTGLQVLGRSEGEILGRNWIGCIVPGDRSAADAELRAAVEENRDMHVIASFMRPDEPPLKLELSAKAMKNTVGQVVSWVGRLSEVS